MSQIRTIYHGHEPNFPATDQHPDAKRYYAFADGRVVMKDELVVEAEPPAYVVDAIGEPTYQEIQDVLGQ